MVGAAALTVVAMTWGTAAEAAVTVSIDPDLEYQTILGWGATTPWTKVPQALRDQILAEAVNELGLTRLRLEGPSGNRSDDRRWEWLNDNGDPDDINWAGFNTAKLDERLSNWVVPFKRRVEANGDPFDAYVSPSFFDGGSSGRVPAWLLHSPGEYAEYATAFLLHLRNSHDITANYYCICNEAGNNNSFSAPVVARMIKALGPKLEALGLPTRIEFPECVNARASWNYIQSVQNDEELWRYVGVITYHLYGTNDPYRSYIRDFAASKGLPTGQTEYMGLSINHMYDDLTLGGVSYWEVYGQWIRPNHDKTSFSRGTQHWNFRQVMHYVRPGAVRIQATSSDSALRPLGFKHDSKITAVLLNNTAPHQARTVTLRGLPSGTYGVCQSVGGAVYEELGVQAFTGKGSLTVNVPANAVLTIYPYWGANLAPTVTKWQASPSYLTVPANTITLSASAADPELAPISYSWSVASQPGGANAVLAKPDSASTSAMGLTVAGQYVFTIAVRDTKNAVTRDVLFNVHAENEPPVMLDVHNRLPVMVTLPTSSTSLRGGAWDLEGDPLTYKWSVVSDPPGAKVSLANAATTGCTASNMSVAGDYVFKLTVSDPTHTVSENLTVSVYPVNASAPFIKSVRASPSNFTLPGTSRTSLSAATGDRYGDVISHWWSVKSAPAGAAPVFSDQGSPETNVTCLTVPGTYVFTLTVVDRTKYTTADVTVSVTGYTGPAAVRGFGFETDSAVGLVWTDFASAYTVEFAGDLVQGNWETMSPPDQWPVLRTSWTGGDTASHTTLFYRVKGE